MTLESLIRDCERRYQDALETGGLLDAAKTWASMADKLKQVQISAPPEDEAWTTAKVGRKLSVEAETVAGYCKQGLFPNAFRTSGNNGHWRIPPADVTAYIRSRKPGAGGDSGTDDNDLIDELDDFLE